MRSFVATLITILGALIATLLVGDGIHYLISPWGIQSPPPRNAVPPSLLERAIASGMKFLIAIAIIALLVFLWQWAHRNPKKARPKQVQDQS